MFFLIGSNGKTVWISYEYKANWVLAFTLIESRDSTSVRIIIPWEETFNERVDIAYFEEVFPEEREDRFSNMSIPHLHQSILNGKLSLYEAYRILNNYNSSIYSEDPEYESDIIYYRNNREPGLMSSSPDWDYIFLSFYDWKVIDGLSVGLPAEITPYYSDNFQFDIYFCLYNWSIVAIKLVEDNTKNNNIWINEYTIPWSHFLSPRIISDWIGVILTPEEEEYIKQKYTRLILLEEENRVKGEEREKVRESLDKLLGN